MTIAISIGVFGVVACCLIAFVARVVSKLECSDETEARPCQQ